MMGRIIGFKGHHFRQVTTVLYQLRIDDTWKYDICHNQHGWYIAAGADYPDERDYHPTKEAAFEQLLDWCNLMPRPTSRPAAIPAVSVAVELPPVSAAKSQQVETYHDDTEDRLHQQSKRLGCCVSNVFYGGDISLEVGLAESLNLLNSYQAATNGLWFECQQEYES